MSRRRRSALRMPAIWVLLVIDLVAGAWLWQHGGRNAVAFAVVAAFGAALVLDTKVGHRRKRRRRS